MMQTSRVVAFPVIAALILGPLLSPAQGMPAFEVMRELSAARRFTCAFPWTVRVAWERQDPQVQQTTEMLMFRIDEIDYGQSRARVTESAGSADLTAFQGLVSVSFLFRGARDTLTTIYPYRDALGRYKAVQSNHNEAGAPALSQHYGYCQAG